MQSNYPIKDFGGYGYFLESQSRYASEWYTHENSINNTVFVTHVVSSHTEAPPGSKFISFVTRRVNINN